MGLDDQILVTFELHRSMRQRGSRASNLQLHTKIQLGFGGVTTGILQRHEEGLSSLLARFGFNSKPELALDYFGLREGPAQPTVQSWDP